MTNTISLLEKALYASALKQKAISNNIANVNTPNFKPAKVEFRQFLQEELDKISFVGTKTNPKHLNIGSSASSEPVLVTQSTVIKNGGNGVDLDYEMSEMTKNTIWYQALTNQINEEFNYLKLAIKGRG